MIQNTNLVVEVAKNEKTFKIINIGGVDIHDGKPKSILALIWQMMRKHVLDILGGVTEEKLVEWANLRVITAPKINSFKDSSLKNSLYLFDIMASIEPRSINKIYVK